MLATSIFEALIRVKVQRKGGRKSSSLCYILQALAVARVRPSADTTNCFRYDKLYLYLICLQMNDLYIFVCDEKDVMVAQECM
jgi:hypothetical protein